LLFLHPEVFESLAIFWSSVPPILDQAACEGKKVFALTSGTYITAHDPNMLHEHWTKILLKIQRLQDAEKAKCKMQKYQTKLEHYTE
jgi:hypothetical protein